MKIYFEDKELNLPVNDNSFRERQIKGAHVLTLYYSLAEHIEIPIGAYCFFEGEKYSLEKPSNFKKINSRNFEYVLILDSVQSSLSKYKFKNTADRRLKFSLTAQPQEHLQMLIDNLNKKEGGWSIGECIEGFEKVVSYNHTSCLEALTMIADAYETEWEINQKTISLRKVEYNKENPLSLGYGRGNGLKSGAGRTNFNESVPVEILYVQGGERNIDASTYNNFYLLLPKNQTLEYNGREYVSDEDGLSIQRTNKPLKSQAEDSVDCSHIYPSRVGEATDVIVVDKDKHFYDFIDSTIPEDLDFAEYLIGGETMTIIFQKGMLAGKEFDVKYKHDSRRFEIVPQEIDGITMPNDTFKPVKGDTYAVFGISLPEAYVCNNTDKSGASWDMFREAAAYMYENEEQRFTFSGELDGIWAKKDWLNIGGKIKLGGYVSFTDAEFVEDSLVRIVGIKDYVNNPYSPIISLSNSPVGSTLSSTLGKIDSNEVVAEDNLAKSIQFAKRNFRSVQETMSMLEDGLLDKFTNGISPITVQTMSLVAGDESLQYEFVDSKDNPIRINHQVQYDSASKVLTVEEGVIRHFTLGVKEITASKDPKESKYFVLPEFQTPSLANATQGYYVYAKCSKTVEEGLFVISEKAIKIDAEAGYWHLLLGLLNSEYDGERSWVSMYGFTEVLPGRITTDRIVSSNGKTFFDLVENVIGGKIFFQDGLLSGLIGIGNNKGVNAGMNGEGNEATDVRIWAGASTQNRASAPFRVLHNGDVVMQNAELQTASFGKRVFIDKDKGRIVLYNTNGIKIAEINDQDNLMGYIELFLENSQQVTKLVAGSLIISNDTAYTDRFMRLGEEGFNAYYKDKANSSLNKSVNFDVNGFRFYKNANKTVDIGDKAIFKNIKKINSKEEHDSLEIGELYNDARDSIIGNVVRVKE
ncbi:MAG: hypothetical protein ACRCZB_04650 [Bacteroidales bacterium]